MASFFSLIKKRFQKKTYVPIPELSTAPDYTKIRNSFVEELRRAAQGQPSSLSYLQHTLHEKPLITKGIVQGIVIGGTNYIISTQKITSGNREILTMKTGELPVIHNQNTLLSFLAEHKDDRAEAVGINFGFPLEPTTGPHGELDGKLLRGTKEHAFNWLIGSTIGDMVRKAFSRDIPAAVANDTVCLTLAGNGNENGSMIVGTGVNIGIKQKTVVINFEIGNFDKFDPSPAIKTVDELSDLPGKQLFEKAISGKYLAEVFNIKAEKMGLSHPRLKTSQELSALSETTGGKDGIEAQKLARALLERSAFLVASALAAVYEFSEKQISSKPQPPLSFPRTRESRSKIDSWFAPTPVKQAASFVRPRNDTAFTIIGEGSLLWKGWQYIPNIEKKLEELGVPKNAIIIKHVKNSSINGAIGLLTN